MKFSSYAAFKDGEMVGWICMPSEATPEDVLETYRKRYGDADSLLPASVTVSGEVTIIPPKEVQ